MSLHFQSAIKSFFFEKNVEIIGHAFFQDTLAGEVTAKPASAAVNSTLTNGHDSNDCGVTSEEDDLAKTAAASEVMTSSTASNGSGGSSDAQLISELTMLRAKYDLVLDRARDLETVIRKLQHENAVLKSDEIDEAEESSSSSNSNSFSSSMTNSALMTSSPAAANRGVDYEDVLQGLEEPQTVEEEVSNVEIVRQVAPRALILRKCYCVAICVRSCNFRISIFQEWEAVQKLPGCDGGSRSR